MGNVLGGTSQIDEIRIGSSWTEVTSVPEPTGIVAIAAVAGVTLLRRRRERGR